MKTENKPMKVWALSYETTIDSPMDPIFNEFLFDSRKKALKEFNKIAEDDKKWFLKNITIIILLLFGFGGFGGFGWGGFGGPWFF